jgi:2-deoxy-D-gluconate 3-dehydrogenase
VADTSAFDLSGKVCLATAGAQGIGRGVALGLARAGADVAVADIHPAVERTAAEVRALGRQSLAIQANLTQRAECERAVDAVVEAFGRIDVLYNGVGGMRRAEDCSYYEVAALDLTEEDIDRTFAVTLKSTLFCAIAAARHMIAQGGGRIINTTSGYATSPGRGRLPYSIAKAGVSILTPGLASEWGPHGVLVNAISPYARTGATAERMDDPVAGERMRSRIAVGRFAEPEEMAGAVVFLASAAGSYVNGEVLTINGGRLY